MTTCDDLDRAWNALLDAGPAGAGLAPPLLDHAAGCPRCRAASARFERLGAALGQLAPPAPPGPGARARFLRAAEDAGYARPKPAPLVPRRTWLVAASVAAAAAWLGFRHGGPAGPAPHPAPAHRVVPIQLAVAWSDARSATLDLARGVSAPAARIGLGVLDLDLAADRPGEPDADADGPEPAAAPDLLQSIGDRLDRGARPLSGSARRAFGFLIPDPGPDPAPGDEPPPEPGPAR